MSYEQIKNFYIDLTATKELGQGSQGTVHPGLNVDTNDQVAAKRTRGVYKQYFNKEEFEKEADLLLHRIPPHENIIKVYDFTKTEYESKGIPMLDLWLITELCELGNVKEFAFSRELSTEQKIEIMYQSALAVRHLHGCKPESIAHRDVKPENILVTGSEDNPIIKLCDFGSAKSVARKSGRSVTMVSLVGTNKYQAPEQFELHDRKFKYNKQIDIFSLGITFLALLKAVKGSLMIPETFNDKGLGEIMWIKQKNEQTFIFSIHKSSDSALVRAVKDVISKMITCEPSSRLSAAQVVDELLTLRTGYLAPQAPTATQLEPATAPQAEPATETQDRAAAPQSEPATETQDRAAAPQSEPATETQDRAAAPQSEPATDCQTLLPGTRVVALSDFDAMEDDELTIKQHDELIITSVPEELGWCQAKDKSGKTGMIPTNFVQTTKEVQVLTTETWPIWTEVVALSKYKAEQKDELSFKKYDVLTITGMTKITGWYEAMNRDGDIGIIPSILVVSKKGVGVPTTEPWPTGTEVVALSKYKAEEEDELSFKKHEVLTITGVTEFTGWYQAMNNSGKIGMIREALVWGKREAVAITTDTWLPGTQVVAVCDYKAREEDELSFEQYDVLTITCGTDEKGWCRAKNKNGKIGMIPSDLMHWRAVANCRIPLPNRTGWPYVKYRLDQD